MLPYKWITVSLLLLGELIFAGPLNAQIVNTLRGFDDDKPGWSGRIEGTFAIAAGNSEYREAKVGSAIQLRSERNRWRLLGSSTWLEASGERAAENQLAHFRHNYRCLSWLASIVFIQGQHDPFRRVESRILIGAGARFDIMKADEWNTAIGITGMREDEKLTGEDKGFVTSHRFSIFLTVFRDVKKGLDVDVTAFFQPRMNDLSDARALASANIRTDIVGNLYLLLSYSLEYDANPPLDVEKYDQTMRSGLGYQF